MTSWHKVDEITSRLCMAWSNARFGDRRIGPQGGEFFDEQDIASIQEVIQELRVECTGTPFPFNPSPFPAPPDPLHELAVLEANRCGFSEGTQARAAAIEAFKAGHRAAIGSMVSKMSNALTKILP